jgi:DNA polymerase I
VDLEATLLSVEVVTVTGRPWLRLWLANGDERFCGWWPAGAGTFFLVPRSDDPALLEDARARTGARTERVEKRLGRGKVHAIRVVTEGASDGSEVSDGFRGDPRVLMLLEADVPADHRFLLDHDVACMGPVRAEIETKEDPRVEGPIFRSIARSDGVAPGSRLRSVAMALEFAETDAGGVRVLRAALAHSGGLESLEAEADPEGDRTVLAALGDRLRQMDPDIILTWGGDARLFPLASARAEALGVPLRIGRDGGVPETRGVGPNRSTSMSGRAHVDLRRVVDRDLRFDVKVKTIASVAEHLNLDVGEDPADAAAEAQALARIGEALLPLQEAFSTLTRVPLDQASRAGRGRQVELLLLAEAAKRNMLAPNRPEGSEADEVYEGGLVLDPAPGLHDEVVSLDFGAMYPNLMIAYNISPDTAIAADEPDPPEGAFRAPEVGHRFLRAPDGFFRQILRNLVDRRRLLKRAVREGRAKGSADPALLARMDVEQTSIKVLTNAMYGYTGWAQARWGSRACAESTAAWGRDTIRWVVDEAKKEGLAVLYADTDGLFVKRPPGFDISKFVAGVNARLPLELEVADRFSVVLFTSAKKKYAGLTEDGHLLARGFEVRRGDWCEFARETQERILETILRERSAAPGVGVAREALDALAAGEVPLEKLTVWKTLTARPAAYKVKPMHAAAVERAEALRPEIRIAVGSKVGIVMIAGPRAAAERATVRDFLRAGDTPDLKWYAEKQVLPAAMRVLEAVGISPEDVQGGPKQRHLSEFF